MWFTYEQVLILRRTELHHHPLPRLGLVGACRLFHFMHLDSMPLEKRSFGYASSGSQAEKRQVSLVKRSRTSTQHLNTNMDGSFLGSLEQPLFILQCKRTSKRTPLLRISSMFSSSFLLCSSTDVGPSIKSCGLMLVVVWVPPKYLVRCQGLYYILY